MLQTRKRNSEIVECLFTDPGALCFTSLPAVSMYQLLYQKQHPKLVHNRVYHFLVLYENINRVFLNKPLSSSSTTWGAMFNSLNTDLALLQYLQIITHTQREISKQTNERRNTSCDARTHIYAQLQYSMKKIKCFTTRKLIWIM